MSGRAQGADTPDMAGKTQNNPKTGLSKAGPRVASRAIITLKEVQPPSPKKPQKRRRTREEEEEEREKKKKSPSCALHVRELRVRSDLRVAGDLGLIRGVERGRNIVLAGIGLGGEVDAREVEVRGRVPASANAGGPVLTG